jgi:hypothetical protein
MSLRDSPREEVKSGPGRRSWERIELKFVKTHVKENGEVQKANKDLYPQIFFSDEFQVCIWNFRNNVCQTSNPFGVSSERKNG